MLKTIFYKTIFLLFITLSLNLSANNISKVEFVDYQKYSGLWYEIARTYNSFQEECVASSVEYKILEPYKYRVYNRCFKNDINGELIAYEGYAKPKDEKNMASITKTYFWIFSEDYEIIYLNDDYTTSIMTDNKLENLWIMHRKPFMSQEEIVKVESFLANYMDINKLIYTKQDKNGKYK